MIAVSCRFSFIGLIRVRGPLVGLLVLSLAIAQSVEAQGSGGVNASAHLNKPHVVLISFDGMRAEYLERLDLPNFARVMQAGVRSEGMIPVFPSKTFPNHYSIVTGLYAERHGLVGNSFWDPQRNAGYGMADSLAVRDGSWYRGEPIWTTAEKQGMVAASYFWVASEASIGGARPSMVKNYDGRVPNFRRVDSVLAWLALPAERRPHIVTLYMSDVDNAGHRHGPLSPQVDTAAWAVDSALGRLLDGIDRLPIRDRTYLILVADHGMSESSPRWYVALDTLIDLHGVRLADAGPNANLHVQGGAERARVLRDSINRRMRHGRAYARGEVPTRLHYNADPRIGDLVVIMDDHFQVGRANRAPRENGGAHGWDPGFRSMHAIFVASGPGIPAGKTIPTFENIEIYPYLTEILSLKPASGIDGRARRLAELIARSR
jgi:predicted AlkP superfamily pyrophosphatase or phosphodiesterase